MRSTLEGFLALDPVARKAVRKLALAVNTPDRRHILNAQAASLKFHESLAHNIVRRRDYTSLHRVFVGKNRLVDSFIVRHLLVKACVSVLTDGDIKRVDELATELDAALKNRKAAYSEIENIAANLAREGKYKGILDILRRIENSFRLDQPEEILYFMMNEQNKARGDAHSRLMEDIITQLDILKIRPKSPDYIYKQILLIDSDGDCITDIDLAVLSDSGTWYILEAKTGKSKNLGVMRQRARRRLIQAVNFLYEKFNMQPKLIGVCRCNRAKEFEWFPVEYEI